MAAYDLFDPYRLLGIDDRSVSADEIRKAFLQRSKTDHPDKGGNAKAFQDLLRAYSILIDDALKTIYDRCGMSGVQEFESNGKPTQELTSGAEETKGNNDDHSQEAFWRELNPNEPVPRGSEIRFDMTTGQKFIYEPIQKNTAPSARQPPSDNDKKGNAPSVQKLLGRFERLCRTKFSAGKMRPKKLKSKFEHFETAYQSVKDPGEVERHAQLAAKFRRLNISQIITSERKEKSNRYCDASNNYMPWKQSTEKLFTGFIDDRCRFL